MLVNAAGPWVDQVIGNAFGKNNAHNVRLVQGSHIIVPPFSTMTAATSSRMRTTGSFSPFHTSAITR